LPDYDSYVTARLDALRNSAYLLCGDWDRGDDLVQRILESLYNHWSRARHADNIDAYVQTMLVNRFLDERRSGWVRRVRLTGDHIALEHSAAPESDPNLRLDVRSALSTLPPRQRAVVVLRFLQDLSVEQTAQVMGCGTGTVKSHTARALARLRPLLGIDDPFGNDARPYPPEAAGAEPTPASGTEVPLPAGRIAP
jgi:RNA polymerase sigma-70 factor (sigma-E family)